MVSEEKGNNMKKSFFSLLFLTIFCSSMIFSQEAKTLFISPNNDGIQDELIIPLSISEKRYIVEWSLIILDSEGNVVRTIGNKEKRPENITVKNFFQSLFAKKEGVTIPESVMWNGILDSGEVASDGKYFYYVTATDDNGNVGKTPVYEITVDNTEPSVEVVPPSESSKIFGGGGKPNITIKQSGSVEDLWTGTITDVAGNVVRTWTWENASPENLVWDGKNDFGVAVPEGVYTYRLTSTDKAGNILEPTVVSNIIYDAIPRSVNMTIKDSPFSPNGDNVKDTLAITPVMSNATGLISWKIETLDKAGKILKAWKGTTEPPTVFDYDGKDSNGIVLADGDYQLKYQAQFNNGQESVITRNFSIDKTAPSAFVKTDNSIFSPDGDGRLDTIEIFQETSKEKAWFAEILDATGKVVKSYEYGEIPPASITWDGTTSENQINDGFYTYKLFATDLAGNVGQAITNTFELNTGTTEVLLSVSEKAFSPNADKVKDSIIFTPQIKTSSAIVEYKLAVLDKDGNTVKTFADKRALPKSFTWNGTSDNGTLCPDGNYTAKLDTLSKNGSESSVSTQSFELDTVYPEAKVEVPYLVFSPNADGRKDVMPLTISSSAENLWQGQILNPEGLVVKSYSWAGAASSFDWDGCDEAGNTVENGKYSFVIATTDPAGNATKVEIKDILLDNTTVKAYLTAEYDSFAPNNDGFRDEQIFSVMVTPTENISAWKFDIKDLDGNIVRSWSNLDSKDVPATIKWNGADVNGLVQEGFFTGNLFVEYEKGDVTAVQSSSFICSVTAPQIAVKTATGSNTEYFSPDNDGYADDLFIMLTGNDVVPFTNWSFEINDPQNGKNFYKISGKNTITERMIWDGRSNSGELVQSATDYPYKFTVTNELGLTSTVSGIIPVDVLVIRVGDKLKIQVPSIIFRSDEADFVGKDVDPKNGLDKDKIDNNNRVLKRIAEILNKFKDYNVTIEGHANNVSGTEEEETIDTVMYGKALVPLSEARANYVKDVLVGFGVDVSRLTTVGVGGRQPVAARDDKDNWWKNRRVEFILNK